MIWPWSKVREPEPAVTPDDRRQLEDLRSELAERHRHVDELAREAQEQARYLREERDRNHLAARFRAAFQGR